MAANWDIRRLYLYLVCFATLMMIIIGTVQVINGVIELIYPEPPYIAEKALPPGTNITAEEKARFEKEQERIAQSEQERQKVWRIRRVATSFALLGVTLPVYLYHWRKIQQNEAV